MSLEKDFGSNRRKKRNILIDPEFQIKYMSILIVLGFGLVTLIGSMSYFFLKDKFVRIIESTELSETSRTLFTQDLWYISACIVLACIVFLVLVSVWALLMSHSVAGPMFHIKRVLTEIKNGNTGERVKLRPRDEFGDVADSLNELLDQIYSPKK